MACGLKLIGFLLILFNIILFLFGLALAAVGVWTVVDKVYVATLISNDLFSAASYIAIVVGVIFLGISVLGICSVRNESRRLVIVYFVVLLVVFVVLLLAAILAVVFKSELEEGMKNKMRNTLTNSYGMDSTITAAWDRLQQELRCCGVQADTGMVGDLEVTRQDSWLLYQSTQWYKEALRKNLQAEELVPASCCITDAKLGSKLVDLSRCQKWKLGPPGNLKSGLKNDALYYDGCYERAQLFVGEQADILVGLAFAFAFSLICGLVLTLMLFRLLGTQTRELNKEQRR